MKYFEEAIRAQQQKAHAAVPSPKPEFQPASEEAEDEWDDVDEDG